MPDQQKSPPDHNGPVVSWHRKDRGPAATSVGLMNQRANRQNAYRAHASTATGLDSRGLIRACIASAGRVELYW